MELHLKFAQNAQFSATASGVSPPLLGARCQGLFGQDCRLLLPLHIYEKSFDHTVFKAMEGNNGYSSSRHQTCKAFGKAVTQRLKLIIHRYAQGLKRSSRRVDALAVPGAVHGMLNDCHEFPRCLNRPPGPGLDNAVRNASCPAFLTVGKNQVGQRRFTPLINNLPGGQIAGGSSISKGHKERLVPLEAEASAGMFELVCTEPEIKEDFRNVRHTRLVKDTVQLSKI
jgi:hypothetical protein